MREARSEIWAVVALLLGVFGPTPPLQGQALSLRDLLDGIQGRRSGARDLRVRYTRELLHTPFFDEFARQEAKTQPPEKGAKTPGPDTGAKTPGPYDAPRPKKVFEAYQLAIQGVKVAYEVFDAREDQSDASWRVKRRAVFDGTLEKSYEPEEKEGMLRLAGPDEVVYFRQPSQLLHLENQDFSSYVQQADIKTEVLGARTEASDVLVDVRTVRESKSRAGTLSLEHRLTINASKDFWATSVQALAIIKDATGAERARIPRSEAQVQGFHQRGERWYPAKVELKKYETESIPPAGGDIPKMGRTDVVSTEVITVLAVDFNRNPPEAEFEFAFPPGTKYLDARDRETYVVDAAGTVGKLAQDMKTPHLPVSEFSRKEAMKVWKDFGAKADRPPGEQVVPRHSLVLWLFLFANVAVVAFILGYSLVRRIRRARSKA